MALCPTSLSLTSPESKLHYLNYKHLERMCMYLCVGTVLYTVVEKAKGVCVDRQGLVFAHKQCTLKYKGQTIF